MFILCHKLSYKLYDGGAFWPWILFIFVLKDLSTFYAGSFAELKLDFKIELFFNSLNSMFEHHLAPNYFYNVLLLV